MDPNWSLKFPNLLSWQPSLAWKKKDNRRQKYSTNLICTPGQLRVPGPSSSCSHNGRWSGSKIVSKAELGHRVDEPGGHVEPEAPLAGAVVVGEGVVVVVEALAHREHWDQPAKFRTWLVHLLSLIEIESNNIWPVLGRANVLVVGLHAEHMSGGVDQPGKVQDGHVSEEVDMKKRSKWSQRNRIEAKKKVYLTTAMK